MKTFLKKIISILHWRLPKEQRPVRFMHSIAITVTFASLVALLVTNLTATQASRVSLTASEQIVQPEQQFKIDVYIDATVPINAASLDVQFDPARVEVLGINRGESVITLWTEDPRVENNKVLLRGGTYRKGFIGRHLIATIRVKALSEGHAAFAMANIQLLSGDGTGNSVPYSTQDNPPRVTIATANSQLATETEVRSLADLDSTERITMREVSIFMAAWSNREVLYDFNNDGKMDLRDFSILLYRFFANR